MYTHNRPEQFSDIFANFYGGDDPYRRAEAAR
jgi:hypothetical protein